MADQNPVQVAFNVSRDIIDAHVKAAVLTALNKDPEALVKAVVTAAMNEKDRNSYSGTTIWDRQVNEMIRDVAKETFQQWLDEMKPLIAKEVRTRLDGKNRKALLDSIVEKLTGTLGRFQVSVHIPD